MRAIKSLVVAAVAAIGMAGVVDADAARGAASGGGSHAGGGHWSGGSHGSGGGHWRGGHGGHFGHSRHFVGWGYYGGFYPYWGWAWPVAFSAAYYWGWPSYGYYYPRVYVERYPAAYPDGVMEPSTQVPYSEGAPRQSPAYRNYCESAKAYYPKVTSCPEGWKFIPAR